MTDMDFFIYLASTPSSGGKLQSVFDCTLGQFLFCSLILYILSFFFIMLAYKKLSTNYEKARFDRELADNNKYHEELRMKHFKIRDKLIYKNAENEDKIRGLDRQISHFEQRLFTANKEKDDAIFTSKRRSKKIKKMEIILQLKSPQLQLNNPDRSIASIIKQYDWSKADL